MSPVMTFALPPNRLHIVHWLLPLLSHRPNSFEIMKSWSFMRTMKIFSTSQTPPLYAETAGGEESTNKMNSPNDTLNLTYLIWLNRLLAFAKGLNVVGIFSGNGYGYSRCLRTGTKVLKLTEGLHNKAFILTMDNGMEIVAKLPNPNAGPARYTTASEVATRKMLRDVFSIPVPRVLLWSCDAKGNPVQAEYILEEKAQGVCLGTLWSTLPWKTKLAIVEQVATFDYSLTTVQFKTHRCIYFKEALQRLSGNADAVQFATDQQSLNLDQYAIGPLTKAELWANGREQMNLDRGPCKSMTDI
ncbi:MAG: hypothetical protein M1820_005842 [Bogoriella megaspora]|nr:MAG: hypothetical protein M1820_005842 [Bogoriella megaspora]